MKSSIEFVSKCGNHYLYDFNCNIGILLHPILFNYIIEGYEIDEDNSILSTYYKEKYQYLQKHGFFQTYSFERNISRLLSEQNIIYQMANTEQLTFEVTEKCNLDCSYCCYGDLYIHHKKREKRSLDFNTATSIIDFCFSLWNSEKNKSKKKNIFIGFYGGEPLLNFEVIEQIVNYVKNKDIYKRVHFTMTTNSILLDKYIDFLVVNNFQLLLSLDGNSSNNVYRKKKNGENSFDLVCKNIDKLYKQYPIFFEQNVNFNAVLHNANSVEDIYCFIKNRYNKIPLLSELNTYGIANKKRKDFNNMYVNYENSILSSAFKKELISNLFVSIPKDTEFGHCCCSYSNPRFEHMFKLNSSTDEHGMCNTVDVTVFASLEYMCEELRSELRRISTKGKMLYDRTESKVLLDFF